jgi:hypothetical protein
MDLDGAVGMAITEVLEATDIGVVTRGRFVAAVRARASAINPSTSDDPRGWKILHPSNPFGALGEVFARSDHV